MRSLRPESAQVVLESSERRRERREPEREALLPRARPAARPSHPRPRRRSSSALCVGSERSRPRRPRQRRRRSRCAQWFERRERKRAGSTHSAIERLPVAPAAVQPVAAPDAPLLLVICVFWQQQQHHHALLGFGLVHVDNGRGSLPEPASTISAALRPEPPYPLFKPTPKYSIQCRRGPAAPSAVPNPEPPRTTLCCPIWGRASIPGASRFRFLQQCLTAAAVHHHTSRIGGRDG